MWQNCTERRIIGYGILNSFFILRLALSCIQIEQIVSNVFLYYSMLSQGYVKAQATSNIYIRTFKAN